MPNIIQIKRGSGKPSSLVLGEFALDTTNKRLYIQTGSSSSGIKELAIVENNNTFTGTNTFQPPDTTSTPVVFKSNQSLAPLGSELVVNGTFDSSSGWTVGSGWTISSGKASHSSGTAPLSQNLTLESGQYIISFAIVDRTSGSVSVKIGNIDIYRHGTETAFSSVTTYYRSFSISTDGTYTLSFNPSSDFVGSIDNVSVKKIIGTAQPNFALVNSSNNTFAEVRGSGSSLAIGLRALQYFTTSPNTAFGYYALSSNTTGTDNVAIGSEALKNNTIGYSNTAVGGSALLSNTTGTFNSAFGWGALKNNTTGSFNTAIGYGTLYNNTTGNNNTALGVDALLSNTSGSGNTSLGYYSLFYLTSGGNNVAVGALSGLSVSSGSNLTSLSNSILIGANVKPYSNGDTNEIVIGYDAVGAGSNSVVIGNDNITKTILKGNIGLGTTNPQLTLTLGSGGNIGVELGVPTNLQASVEYNTGGTVEDGTYYYMVSASDGTGFTVPCNPITVIVNSQEP